MTELYRAMISSTTKDMLVHRQQALDACIRQDFFPVMMEHLPPSPDDAVRRSLDLVDQADVYVLVLGLRYGEIPGGYEKSYTHLELDRAVERGIPVLVLLTSPQHHFTETDIDLGAASEPVRQLREEVRRHGVSYFSSPGDLRSLLIDGLADIRQRLSPRSALTRHANRPDPPPAPLVVGPYTLLQTTEVVGRQQELDVLTDWVSDPGTDVYRARVFVLLAIGGMGKSAVAWKWFHDIAPQELPTLAGRVWWSFYETDARFDNFVLRTLGYLTGRSVEELRTSRAPEREEELLDILALACAEEAGDWHLRTQVLGSTAYQASWCGDPDAGLAYTESALVRVRRLTATERDMLHNSRARDLAKLGEVQDALSAIGAADEEFSHARPAEDPPWMASYTRLGSR